MRRILLSLSLLLALLANPLVVVAGQLSIPNTFVNGEVADADEVNANFDAVQAEVNNNDARVTAVEAGTVAAQSTADTALTDAAAAQATATAAAAGHTVDTNTQLSESEVEAAAVAQGFVKGAHTVDTNTQLDEAAVDGFVSNNGFASEADVAALEEQLASLKLVPTSLSTIPFPVHRDELAFVDRKPLFCWLQTAGTGLKFNTGKIYITDQGDDVDLQVAIYRLTSSATFDKYPTYNNSTRVVLSNNITWTSSDGPNGNGEGFVTFTFADTTLDSTSHYFVGLFNDVAGGDEPKYLGYKDAGDPVGSLENLFFLGYSNQASPGTVMQNTINAGAKGDPPYINLFHQ